MASRHKRQLSRTHNLVASRKQPPKEETDEDFFRQFPIQVQTGLGESIDKYVALSPTLTRQIQEIKKRRWEIVWSNNAGNYTLWNPKTNTGQISMDASMNHGISDDSTDAKYQLKYIISVLAHEVGHAFNLIPPDTSSYEACMESLISGPGSEGNAAYNSVIVRQEIMMNTHNKIDTFLNSGEGRGKMLSFVEIVANNSKKDAMHKLGVTYLPERQSIGAGGTYEEEYGKLCKPFGKKK